jgi:methylenetetrahydrofolate reductase (NADPH)
MKFSLEVTPKADISELPQAIKDISVTYLPNANYLAVVAQARNLHLNGFNPIPHIPARSIKNRHHLNDFVRRLKVEANISQVLIIGGSRSPIGDYHSTLQLLETGLFEGMRVGVAGHPEGTPDISPEECDAALIQKNEFARATGTEMYVVTQWSLNPDKIIAWLERIQGFNTLPIHLGIAGPASLNSLLKFAAICGVNVSLKGLRIHQKNLIHLMTIQTPDFIIDALQDRVEQFHVYPFGGVARTKSWLEERAWGMGHRALASNYPPRTYANF